MSHREEAKRQIRKEIKGYAGIPFESLSAIEQRLFNALFAEREKNLAVKEHLDKAGITDASKLGEFVKAVLDKVNPISPVSPVAIAYAALTKKG